MTDTRTPTAAAKTTDAIPEASDETTIMDPWSVFSAPSSDPQQVDNGSSPTTTTMMAAGNRTSSVARMPLKTRLSNFQKRVSERMAESRAHRQSATAIAEEAAKKELEGKAASTLLTELKDEEYEQLRPSKVSVSIFKEEDEPYGFSIDQKEGEKVLKRTVVITSLAEYGLLRNSPLKEGDYLRRVNGQRVTNAEACVEHLVKLKGHVSLEAETPQGNPALVAAFVRKPSPDYDDLGVVFVNTEHEYETVDNNCETKSTQEQQGETSTTTTMTKTNTKTQLLKIGDLRANNSDSVEETGGPSNVNDISSKTGLLADSVLSPGDLVVAINGMPCANMDAVEAMEIIRNARDTVTIMAINPKAHANATGPTPAQRFLRQAKRTGIAISGGGMVGVGLILIPTVPPPFGEILIAGGVTVLSTEFEAPKRVVRSARDSLETSVGRHEETVAAEAAGLDNNNSSDQGDDNTSIKCEEKGSEVEPNNGNDKKNPDKWRGLKSFSRKYVLPFLDEVVGDRKHDVDKNNDGKQDETETSLLPSSPSAYEKIQESDPPPNEKSESTNSEVAAESKIDESKSLDGDQNPVVVEEKKIDG